MKKNILICFVVFGLILLMGAAIIGYQDIQVITTPGNPASGYVRLFANSSGLRCLTSSGGNCLAGSIATVASGTSALGTSAIASGTCASTITVTATGIATTDVLEASVNGDPTAITGYLPSSTGSLYIWAYPTVNNANFKVCNNTGSSITPGTVTLNWIVIR
jgi:hypothetical protein